MKKLSFFLMAMLFSVMSFAAEVTVKISDYATANGWNDATQYKTLKMDDNVSITVAGSSNTGKYYTNGNNWRMYQNESPKITLTATNGNILKTVKFTYTVNNTGILVDASKAQVQSGVVYTFADEVTTYTFGVGNTGTAANGQVRFSEITVVYDVPTPSNPDAVKYTVTAKVNDPAMGTVTGAGEYEEGKTATLTANANAGYKFVNWSTGSTANPLKITVTEDVEVTANFEAIPPMTCAEAADAAKDATVVLNPFDVVYVVKDAGYIYIKDESGVNLIFDYNLAKDLKAGDHVEGFVGVSSPYNGLPELKPSVAFADLTVTQGTAPEPTVFTDAPVQADVNKYVKFENVTLTANATFNADGATNATMIVNGKNVTLRNNFKLAATLSQYKAYDIVGFVAIYYSDIQVYFLSATEVADLEREEYTISWSVNGTIKETTTVLEGDKLVLPTAPAAPDACSEKVFVGWATTSTVNADGSDIDYVTNATVPTESTTYYAVFATQEGEGGAAEEGTVTLAYTGTTTSNMDVEANNAAAVGLDATKWNVIAAKGDNTSAPGLNKAGDIRLYYGNPTSNSITVTSLDETVTISTIVITYTGDTYNNGKILVNDAAVTGTDGTYEINANSFTITNGNTSNAQVRIKNIVINYFAGAAATYTNYSTTCDGTSTDIENIAVEGKAVKAIINGQLVIVKDGVKFNALGQVIK